MYAICMLFNYEFLCYIFERVMCSHNLRIEGIITTVNWLNWLCICFVIEWLFVQTLLGTKLFSFCQIFLGMNVKRFRNPSSQEGSREC